MTPLNYAEIEIKNEIMATDIYLYASSLIHPKSQIQADLEIVIDMLKDFEKRFSRFTPDNELDILNKSTELKISDELFELLALSKEYLNLTNGYFNPTILEILKMEGYSESITSTQIESHNETLSTPTPITSLDLLELNALTKTIKKPSNLKIDLGGIGKSYIVNKSSQFLATKYTDYCVNAGGDMYLGGKDSLNNYEYWAINIENPLISDSTFKGLQTPTLTLRDMAVCTSGINRRRWKHNNQEKNHLINPFTKQSVQNEIVTATVISKNIIEADVFAKILIMMGLEKSRNFCDERKIPSVIITKTGKIIISSEAHRYVWKEKN